ncbi:hypothetical protein [Candidatus Avelusimicrobium fimicolum]|uniref:hypothetical protein n=1 Tax=Candidatus Avelusimicrobium fimicolum TaxID=3416216 RepID=UPI003D0E7B77
MRVPGTRNLIPLNKRNAKDVQRITSMGGKASVKTKRLQKSFREIGKFVLGGNPPDNVLDLFCERFPDIPREEMNYKVTAYLAVLHKAIMSGDVQAFDRLVDVAGEKNPETSVVLQKNDPADLKKSVKEVKKLLGEL